MEEIWKDIPGYEGYYQVSNHGNVRNSRGQTINPYKHHNKFLKVELWKGGNRKKMFVHRLVKDLFNLTFTPMLGEIKEEWRDIPGYEGYYKISNLGRVLRLPRCKPTDKRNTHNNIRKQRLSDNGYWRVNLSKDNKVKWFNIHRLVAMTFIPNPDNLPCVNHKDENPLNNCVDNLEWCTVQYNCEYGTARERQRISRANNPNDKFVRKLVGEKNSKPIRCFTPNGDLYGEYKSMSEASEATKVHISTIIRHCKGRVGNEMNRPIRKFRFEYAV